jgi:hypothetical protein
MMEKYICEKYKPSFNLIGKWCSECKPLEAVNVIDRFRITMDMC